MSKKVTRLEKTAYHEAGHAVISDFLGVGFGTATIIPNYEHREAGSVETKWTPEAMDQMQYGWIYFAGIMTQLAGPAAVKHLTGFWPNKELWKSDLDTAFRLACMDYEVSSLFGSKVINASRLEVLSLVAENWPEIEIIARNLLEKSTLTALEIHNLAAKSRCERRGIDCATIDINI